MKTNGKHIRLISVLTAVLMIVTVFSIVPVFAAEDSGESGSLAWTYNDETCALTITGEGDLTDDIGDQFFKYARDIKSIEFGEGITSVNERAFQNNFTEVESLKFSSSLKSIGEQAFEYCESLKTVEWGGVEVIGSKAFGCCGFSSVSFNSNLRTIGKMAFYECEHLSEVKLGSGVTKVGELAFESTALKRIQIPGNVTSIGKKAFGYYYDERDDDDGTTAGYGYYPVMYFEVKASKDSVGAKYAKDNKFTLVTGAPAFSPKSLTMKAGEAKSLKYINAAVINYGTNKPSVAVYKNGKVYGLKKGTAKIGVLRGDFGVAYCTVKVTSNPTIKIGGKAFKSSKTYTVKKGSALTVKITGKSSIVKNKYATTNKKIAKVVSKTTAKTVKIKGYKKGSAKVTVNVNGVAFKIKVKVK